MKLVIQDGDLHLWLVAIILKFKDIMMKLHGMILFNILQSLHSSPFVATCTCMFQNYSVILNLSYNENKVKPLLGCIGVKLPLFFWGEGEFSK